MTPVVAVAVALVFALLLFILYKWKSGRGDVFKECPPCTPVQLVHRLCPHHNVVQSFEVEQKDSLDEHLDVLTKKLAEKEGRLRLSKSKIRETQHEIDNLHAIDHDVKVKYREIMESLRSDLLSNEKDCKKLQEQIEWVSRRRAELRDEARKSCQLDNCPHNCFNLVRWSLASPPAAHYKSHYTEDLNKNLTKRTSSKVWIGQKRYGQAAAELASNLTELQRGRVDHRVTEKPQNQHSHTCVRHRKEPHLPTAASVKSLVIKSPPTSDDAVLSNIHQSRM